jgi:2-polyprenyl-3-methyl-5-hydroxy-6-metoxy-1,4-benzoquinol methylase
MSKLGYFLRSAAQFSNAEAARCRNCGSVSSTEKDRKYFVTRLLRCHDCQLMFRAPTDSEEFNHVFYNFHYQQGTTTTCPTDAAIAELKSLMFRNTEQDYAGYIGFLARHGVRKGQLFDFGCSWGYGSYQFARAGYDVHSYEIALDRRTYAIEKLDIGHIDEPFAIREGHPLHQAFDCFFTAHVLEHVPAPSKVIALAWRCLKDGGAFVAFTPNGNDEYRTFNPRSWRRMWGGVHPNYLDHVFYEQHFQRSRRWYGARDGSDVNKQYELGFIAFKDAGKGGF